MRLIDIQEELEQSNITREELLNQIHNILYSINTFRVPVTNGVASLSIPRQRVLEEGQISIGVSYYPIEPECNENMFKEPMVHFLKELFETLDETLKKTDPTILSGIKINYIGYTMYYKEGILNFLSRDLIDRLDMVNIMSDISLLDAYTNLDLALSDHVIPIDRLPRFGGEYSLAMDKAIKRIKTIYLAHKKGKFRGLPYQLPDEPITTVHQNQSSSWDEHSRVLLPIFDLSISSVPMNSIEYEGDKVELRNALIKKFQHFGIQFN
jgi:hypothetical protein